MTHETVPAGSGLAREVIFGALAHTFYRRLEWLEPPLLVDRPVLEARVPLEFGFLEVGQADEIAVLRVASLLAAAQLAVRRAEPPPGGAPHAVGSDEPPQASRTELSAQHC